MLKFKARKRTTEVILHASHTRPSKGNLIAFLKVKGREMGLLECGYHFVILRDGLVIDTRPHTVQGTHCPGYNTESIGVLLAGGVNEDDQQQQEDNFTEEQYVSLKGVFQILEDYYGPLQLRGHTEKPRYRGRTWRCPPTDMEKVRRYVYSADQDDPPTGAGIQLP